jgi:hypothetical protein
MLRNIRVDRLTFQIFFLKNDENQRVVVEEVSKIDFEKVKSHLEKGESVFIAPKRQGELRTSQVEKDDFEEHWYFTHI